MGTKNSYWSYRLKHEKLKGRNLRLVIFARRLLFFSDSGDALLQSHVRRASGAAKPETLTTSTAWFGVIAGASTSPSSQVRVSGEPGSPRNKVRWQVGFRSGYTDSHEDPSPQLRHVLPQGRR